MSHLTRIRTKIADRDMLVAALRKLGYDVIEGPTTVRDVLLDTRPVDLKISLPQEGREIGFALENGSYTIVADWWRVSETSGDRLKRQLQEEIEEATHRVRQQYAVTATKEKLAEQGFDVVEESTEESGEVRLLLRRMA